MNFNPPVFEPFLKIEKKESPSRQAWEKKREKEYQDSKKAEVIADKFLEDNPNVNIGYVIKHLQKQIISTTQCCTKLGISPGAFLRLRRKYNIEPAFSLKNNDAKSAKLSNKTFVMPSNLAFKAIKNFYNPKQLNSIPQSEIDKIQVRAARSLGFPNGENVKWKWTRRGFQINGKLKARTDILTKCGIRVSYNTDTDKYTVYFKGYDNRQISRREVDKLNFKIAKLKSFL